MGIFNALPPGGGSSALAVDVGVDGGRVALSNGRSWNLAGDLDITFYLRRPVVDDASPLSLQPFLQRVSSVRVGVGAGASVSVSHGAPYIDVSTVYDTYGGSLGASYWLTSGVEVAAAYAPTWRVARSDSFEHHVGVSLVVRPR